MPNAALRRALQAGRNDRMKLNVKSTGSPTFILHTCSANELAFLYCLLTVRLAS